MNALAESTADERLRRLQQGIKWTVYTLLIINFVFYVLEDYDRAVHTLQPGASVLDWAAEFATTIDELGWFLLLFMFELETYVLEDEEWSGWVAHTVRGLRVACYLMILHTVYVYAGAVVDLEPTVPVAEAAHPCDLADRDVSWVRNLEYTAIDADTCVALTSADRLYWVGTDPVVTDLEGLELERTLAWVDLLEASTWLLIVLAIEATVRLQGRGRSGGALITALNRLKLLLYGVLFAAGAYWATLSHWLYVWDEFVWVAGFAAIEMNLSQWRDEIRQRLPIGG